MNQTVFGLLVVIAGSWLSGCVAPAADAEPPDLPSAEAAVTAHDVERSGDACDNAAFVASAYDKVLNHLDTHALDTMFAEDLIQHNSTFPDGRAGLAAFVEFRRTQQPEAHNEIVRVIAQGDLVALHVHATTTAAERDDPHAGVAIVDIFRVADHKIVEHWDVIEAVPPTSANPHTMFDGGTAGDARGRHRESERNAQLVATAYDTVLNKFDTSPLSTVFADDLVQHNPNFPDGTSALAGFAAFRSSQQPEAHNEIVRVIADGDLVLLHVHVTTTLAERDDPHAGVAIVDIFRVAEGKIVEHWDVVQPVPPTSVNGHTMFDSGGRGLIGYR